MPSPVGVLRLVAHDQALVAVLWENENPKRVRLAELVEHNQHPILLETEKQLSEYIALQIGNVKAVRAVGAANGKNPISIIAPCHRVVGANGKLVGFAGGLDNKDILLKLEKIAN